MKRMKWLCGLIVFAFCFVLSSEMAQNYLSDFTEQFYYIDASTEDRRMLCDVLLNVSAQHQTPVLAVQKEYPTRQAANITVYIAEQNMPSFQDEFSIQPGIYRSFFSGETKIQYRDFTEIQEHADIERFYFQAASMREMDSIYHQIAQYFGTSYVHQEGASGLHLILNVIWILPLLFMLLLTLFSVQFDRRKEFIRISLGASKTSIILRGAAIDAAVFGTEFFGAFFILDHLIFIRYHLEFTLLLFGIFLLLNSLLHCTLLRFRYKEILYGANLNMRLLSNCYLMKSAVLILTIFSVSVNTYLIQGQMHYLRYKNVTDAHNTAYFLSLKPAPDSDIEETAAQILLDQLSLDRAQFSYIYAETESPGRYVCCMNDSSMMMTQRLRNLLNPDADFCFLYPENLQSQFCTEDSVHAMIESCFGIDPRTVQCSMIPYDFKATVLYINTALSNGFEIADSPCVLFCNTARITFRNAVKNSARLDTAFFQDTMFQVHPSEEEQFKHTYLLSECRFLPAAEVFNARQAMMMRIVLLNTVISTLMIALHMSVCAAIIRIQYAIHAKRLAVMKILGYSAMQMHASIFILNMFSVIIGLVTNLILSVMYQKTKWIYVLLIGILLIATDTVLTLYHIRRTERVSTQKILKGGSL